MTDTFEIFCDDPFHEGAEVPVRTFRSNGHNWYGLGLQGLRSNEYVSDRVPDGSNAADRFRYNLRCSCGVAVPARQEKLDQILTRLSDAGVTRLSLAGLATIL